MGCPHKGLTPTMAIGLATGYKRKMSSRTKGANVAPMARPYLLQIAVGLVTVEAWVRTLRNDS